MNRLAPADLPIPLAVKENPRSAYGSSIQEIRYFKLTAEPHDFLAALLESLRVRLVRTPRDAALEAEPVLINAVDASDERITAFLEECQPSHSRILVGTNAGRPAKSPSGSFLALPCSFGHFVKQLCSFATSG